MLVVIALSALVLLTCAADRKDTVPIGSIREAPAPKRTITVRQWRQSTLVISAAPFETRIFSLGSKSVGEYVSIRSSKDTLRLPTEPKGYILEIYGLPRIGTKPDTVMKIGPNGTTLPFSVSDFPSR